MMALLVDHQSPCHLRMAEAQDPILQVDEALVRVVGTSLNMGEVSRLPDTSEEVIPGWDASGVIAKAAENGSGPPVGTPVVTIDARGGGWAELRTCRTDHMAPLAAEADIGAFAALPVAGLTALRSLRSIGFFAGRRLMVTGASGGVGRLLIQLARLGGADVVAVASKSSHEELAEIGAVETVTRPSEVREEVWAVLDLVGGATLPESFDMLADPGGRVVSIGHLADQDEVFGAGALRATSRSIETFYLFANMTGIEVDLALLVELVARGELVLPISWRGSWRDHCDAVAQITDRHLHGKAVLDVR